MDGGVQHIVTPQGDVLVVMPLAQYREMSAAAQGLFAFDVGSANAVGNGTGIADSARPAPFAGIESQTPEAVRRAIAAGESPLAAWRKFRDISQTKLARAAGVSRFTVIRMEAGGAGAGNRQSRRLLASALGIAVGAL